MIKDILLAMTHDNVNAAALTSAVNLAESEAAHLAIVIPVEYPMPVPSEFGISPYSIYLGVYEDSLKAAEMLAVNLREKLKNTAIATEVRVVSTPLMNSAQISALHARHADLSVIGGDEAGSVSAAFENMFTELLMDSGRPVLFIPSACEVVTPAKRILIAWTPTRESSRAVHDAMPLLYKSESIDVLIIDPEVSESAYGEQPGADIATHLARHGLNVRVVVQPKMGKNKGQAILEHAKQMDAQLIVAGGYGHSRFRELILGGVTRELIKNMKFPVLFAH